MPQSSLLTDFSQFADAAKKTLQDQKRAKNGQFFYNIDFNIVYPYLWQKTIKEPSAYIQYDQVALNIIALLLSNPHGCFFRPLFTTPSILELLDFISHRLAKAKQAAENEDVFRRILNTVDRWSRNDWRQLALNNTPYWSILNDIRFHLNINDADHLSDGLSRLFGDNAPLSRHVEEEALAAVATEGPLFREKCNQLLHLMNEGRVAGDQREFKDRIFHYKIDCANIVLSTFIERKDPGTHAEFVCSPKVRAYNPWNHGRSPLVCLLGLYAADRFRSKLEVSKEVSEYLTALESACRDCITVLQHEPDIRNLPEIHLENLKVTQLRFIDPLLSPLNPPPEQAGEEIENSVMGMLSSSDRFRQKSCAAQHYLQKATMRIVELRPAIVSRRLLEDIGMAADPRVEDIFRDVGLR